MAAVLVLGWRALWRDSAGVAQLIQVWVRAGWHQLLLQGWGKGTFWAEPFSLCAPAVFGWGSSEAAVGTGVVLGGIPREWAASEVPEQPLPSSWCRQLHIFQRAGGKPSAAGEFAAFTTGFGLTTGMKKMGVRHEPTAGGTLGNPSVTMGRSVLPMICEFLCFESTLSVTVPALTQGMGFPSQRVSVTFDGFHKTSTEIMRKQILCWTECLNWMILQWACWDPDSQQGDSLHKMFQANLLWVNWYDRMMNAEVLWCSNCTNVEMLIVWAQLPRAGCPSDVAAPAAADPGTGAWHRQCGCWGGAEVCAQGCPDPGKNGF